jgi:hypothetical protein
VALLRPRTGKIWQPSLGRIVNVRLRTGQSVNPRAALGRLRKLDPVALRILWDTAEHLPGSWSVHATLAVGFTRRQVVWRMLRALTLPTPYSV